MPAIAERFYYTANNPCLRVAALGCFDGVHIGHATLLKETERLARLYGLSAVAVSFEYPPAMIQNPGTAKIITDVRERSDIFEKMGLDASFFLRFEDVRDMSADDFIEKLLVKELGVRAVVCGTNFSFGKDRLGTPDTLVSYFGDRAKIMPTVMRGGLPVSSSRIRQLISDGKIDEADSMLSFPLSYTGEAFRGRGDGSRIGFPTANVLPPENKILPPPGVYVSTVEVPGEGVFPAVSDAGYAPTLDSSGIFRIEAHILDYASPLHGKKLRVTLLSRIRGEKRFDSAAELASAIENDVNTARAYFAGRSDK